MKLKEIFHSENERELLAHNGLGSFESLWDLEGHFIEEPNYRRGGQIKTDVVNFKYSDLDLLGPWEIKSNDSRVSLLFYPEGERAADINICLIASRFNQPFGKFEGRLTDGKES